MPASVSTLSELFLKAATYNKPDCLLYKIGGSYQPVSTAELVDRVRRLSKALRELGVERGDRVALMSENGPHWPTVDFATLCIGAVLVPIYPTLLPDQSSYIVKNCGAKVVFAETNAHLDGMLSNADELTDVRQFVIIKGDSKDPRVTTMAALLEKGQGVDPGEFEERARAVTPDDLATFIYTSGTTGTPKGVMLTHDNVAASIESFHRIVPPMDHRIVSLLPLSHLLEQAVGLYYALDVGADIL